MTLDEFYQQVLKYGIQRDPRRDKPRIKSFSDSGILFGDRKVQVRKIMVGIDIEVPELLLAERVRERRGLDLVVAHHPEGRPFALLHCVMNLHVDVLKNAGVPEDTARQLMDERILDISRRLLSANHTRAVDAARILKMPFLCMHTPADNHVYSRIQALMNRRKPRRVQEIIGLLMEFEEYREAARIGTEPRVIFGNPRAHAGKILVDMTGGTEGHTGVFDKLYKAGIRTVICMHLSEEHFRKVRDTALNVIIAGHISSDNLGMNLLLDRIEKHARREFEIVEASGFKRVRRN